MEYIYDYNTLRSLRFLRKIRTYKQIGFLKDRINWIWSFISLSIIVLAVCLANPSVHQALNNAASYINGPPLVNAASIMDPITSGGFDLGSARIVVIGSDHTCLMQDQYGHQVRIPLDQTQLLFTPTTTSPANMDSGQNQEISPTNPTQNPNAPQGTAAVIIVPTRQNSATTYSAPPNTPSFINVPSPVPLPPPSPRPPVILPVPLNPSPAPVASPLPTTPAPAPAPPPIIVPTPSPTPVSAPVHLPQPAPAPVLPPPAPNPSPVPVPAPVPAPIPVPIPVPTPIPPPPVNLPKI